MSHGVFEVCSGDRGGSFSLSVLQWFQSAASATSEAYSIEANGFFRAHQDSDVMDRLLASSVAIVLKAALSFLIECLFLAYHLKISRHVINIKELKSCCGWNRQMVATFIGGSKVQRSQMALLSPGSPVVQEIWILVFLFRGWPYWSLYLGLFFFSLIFPFAFLPSPEVLGFNWHLTVCLSFSLFS